MPGAVANAVASTVLPAFLCSAFVAGRDWPVEESWYQNGERQARSRTTAARRSWDLIPRVPPSTLGSLRTFLWARRWIEAFYFYDGLRTIPKWSHDPTGVEVIGRVTVVARGTWVQSMGLALGDADVHLVEVA